MAEVPAWLAEPLAAVVSDLQGPEPLDFSARWSGGAVTADEDGTLEVGGAGRKSVWRLKAEQLKVELAEWLQDQYVLGQHVMPVRPVCPGRPHPAHPYLRNGGEAWWQCPDSGRPLHRIGAWEPAC